MIHVFEEWHKVIIHPCWHSQRKRWVVDTPLILLQHSRTESLHLVNSDGVDSAHQTGSEHGVARSQCQNQLKVQIKKSGLWPSLPPHCFSSMPPSPALTLCSCIFSTSAGHAHSHVHLPHIAEVSFSTI